ncbi:MAG: hypothetical protein WA823_14995 [Candidatus Acidiferrales bacterium]
MRKDDPILKTAQRELEKHQWGHFVEGDTRTVADGGKGTIAVGCVACEKRLNTIPQFMEHLAEDVLPQIIDEVLERKAIAES